MTGDPTLEREVGIVNRLGLHARAAARFASLAQSFDARVELARGDMRVDGKSILGVLMLGAAKGTRIRIITSGPDAAGAMDALCGLVEDGFGKESQ